MSDNEVCDTCGVEFSAFGINCNCHLSDTPTPADINDQIDYIIERLGFLRPNSPRPFSEYTPDDLEGWRNEAVEILQGVITLVNTISSL
jgi:hypothetical protein